MTFDFYLQDRFLGTMTSQGGDVHVTGPGQTGLQERLSYYAGVTGLQGDSLLRYLAVRTRGYNRCVMRKG
jgi:hypothetical protein